jgi:hypothetical protein
MSKEKTFRTVIRVPESIHGAMQEQAREAGYDDGRGPGLAKYLISLHVAHVDELGRCYADLIADAFPKPVEVVPEVVTFEGMTPGERWYALRDAYWLADFDSDFEAAIDKVWSTFDDVSSQAVDLSPYVPHPIAGDVFKGQRKACYDAALEYVKGVMDGK